MRKEIRDLEVSEYADESNYELDMSLTCNPLGPPETVEKELESLTSKEISGYRMVSERAISNVSSITGIDKQNLAVTNGCDGGLDLVAQTFFNPSVTVDIPVPSFPRYELYCKKMGAKINHIESDSSIHPGIEQLKKSEGDYMILANPQNPTGERFSIDQMEDLNSSIPGTLIVDEAQIMMENTHSTLIDKGVIVAGSFSKIFGMAGLRLGYLGMQDIGKIKKIKSPFLVNSCGTKALETLEEPDEYLKKSREYIKAQNNLIKENLDELGLNYSSSRCLILLMDLSESNISGKKVHEALLDRDVKITAGDNFRTLNDNYLRIGVRKEEQNREFLSILRGIVEEKR